jgi:ribonuclease HI
MTELACEANLNISNIAEISLPSLPPWSMRRPIISFDLHTQAKSDEPPYVAKLKFYEYAFKVRNHTHIFTDGSKDCQAVAAAAVFDGGQVTTRIPSSASIFTAEAQALDHAVQVAAGSDDSAFTIFSDSMSCLKALQSHKLTHPIILATLESVHHRMSSGKLITFCWIPSHVGIKGNELADRAAKDALTHILEDSFKIPHYDLKHDINMYIKSKMQTSWNNTIFNKLHTIKNVLGETKILNAKSRKNEVVFHRLRIGHTYCTHSYLLRREPAPDCNVCLCLLTVVHFMCQCIATQQQRLKHLNNKTLKDTLSPPNIENVVLYLKEINMFDKI